MNLEMLELVLTELLEEQKKETITNAEMVSIVKRVLEKLEMMEQLIQPKDYPAILERLRAIQIACQGRSEKPAIPPAQITQVRTVIKHHYYFKTTAVIAVSFFIIILLLTCIYIGKKKEASAYKANDIKFRYLKLLDNPTLNRVLRQSDSLYLFAPDSIQKVVIWKEGRVHEKLEFSNRSNQQKQPEKQPYKKVGKKNSK